MRVFCGKKRPCRICDVFHINKLLKELCLIAVSCQEIQSWPFNPDPVFSYHTSDERKREQV
jgi:hypothetical protein